MGLVVKQPKNGISATKGGKPESCSLRSLCDELENSKNQDFRHAGTRWRSLEDGITKGAPIRPGDSLYLLLLDIVANLATVERSREFDDKLVAKVSKEIQGLRT